MDQFSLDKASEEIAHGKTAEYFKEVLSSYNNGNYRSAVVMLWSVAICDIVFKLQSLVDLYEDQSAQAILQEITSMQEADQKSAKWETKLLDDVLKKTNLIDTAEYENLRHLQQQRHLSAHPILNRERELHSPNKDTVRSLLRNTLTDLLIKPPFYTQHILNELLSDIAESKLALTTLTKIRQYVESKYLSRVKQPVELNLFRSLWKLVFKLENDHCNTNRLINLRVTLVIAERNRTALIGAISKERDYYSNIASSGSPLSYLVYFLSKHDQVFSLLDEAAQIKIRHCINEDEVGRCLGWFVKQSLEEHRINIEEWIKSKEKPSFVPEQLEAILEISDSEEWERQFCKIVATYYTSSTSFAQADARFQIAISSYIHLFDKESIEYFLTRIENNSQCHSRNAATRDYTTIQNRINELYVDGFEYERYFWFSHKLGISN